MNQTLTIETTELSTMKSEQNKVFQQQYQEELEISKLVSLELYSAFIYHQLASHFSQDNVALPVFEDFFRKLSREEQRHAETLLQFHGSRGTMLLDAKDIDVYMEPHEWNSSLEAMTAALDVEKTINQTLFRLTELATELNDEHCLDFLATQYHTEQKQTIRRLSSYDISFQPLGERLSNIFEKDSHRKHECTR